MDKDKQIAPQRNEITKWQEAYVEEFESPKTILVSEDEWKRVNEEVRRLEKELRETEKNFLSEQDKYAKQLKDAVRKLEKAEKPTYRICVEVRYTRGDYVNLPEYTYVDRDFELSPDVLKEIRKYLKTVEVGVHEHLLDLRDEIAYDLVKEITQRCQNYLNDHPLYTTTGVWPFKRRCKDTELANKLCDVLSFAINLGALQIKPSPDYEWVESGSWSYRKAAIPEAWGLKSHRQLNWPGLQTVIKDLKREYGANTEEQND